MSCVVRGPCRVQAKIALCAGACTTSQLLWIWLYDILQQSPHANIPTFSGFGATWSSCLCAALKMQRTRSREHKGVEWHTMLNTTSKRHVVRLLGNHAAMIY